MKYKVGETGKLPVKYRHLGEGMRQKAGIRGESSTKKQKNVLVSI